MFSYYADSRDREIPPEAKNLLDCYGINMILDFIPARRDIPYEDLRLNWRATIFRFEEVILVTDVSEGIGFCPSYLKDRALTGKRREDIIYECIHGRFYEDKSKVIEPPSWPTVLKNILCYENTADCASFEDWCQNNLREDEADSISLKKL